MGRGQMFEPAIEEASRDELRTLQETRLSAQIARCTASPGIYRSQLDSVGAEPEDIRSLEDLARLPVVTKEELRDDQLRHPPFGTFVVADAAEFRELHPSTGTTGTPVNTIWSAADVETITSCHRAHALAVRRPARRRDPERVRVRPLGRGPERALRRCENRLPRRPDRDDDADREAGRLPALRRARRCCWPPRATASTSRRRSANAASILRACRFGSGASAARPARRTRRRGQSSRSASGSTPSTTTAWPRSGRPSRPNARPRRGSISPRTTSSSSASIPTPGSPVPEGELGVLVFTHLTREASPVIRYWSNDYARLSTERCACGRTHLRAVDGIVGRHDDLVVFQGAKFYPSQVEKVVRVVRRALGRVPDRGGCGRRHARRALHGRLRAPRLGARGSSRGSRTRCAPSSASRPS